MSGRKEQGGLMARRRPSLPRWREVVSTPWTLAANFDFAYPQTTGERPPDLEEGARYFMALEALCAKDVQVQILVMEVINLAKPLSVLSEEPLRSRVLARMRRQRRDG